METQSLSVFEEQDREDTQKDEWILKELKPNHKQLCALLAQGMKSKQAAAMVGITPEYVSMLLRQPVIKAEIARLSEVAGIRLEGMFEQVVDVIGDALTNGTHSEKLKAGRLHGELTKRIGKHEVLPDSMGAGEERLQRLAERLEFLTKSKIPGVYNENGEVIEEAVVVRERAFDGSYQTSKENGNAASGNQESR